jgi:predicted metalloprotease with PDZ domain
MRQEKSEYHRIVLVASICFLTASSLIGQSLGTNDSPDSPVLGIELEPAYSLGGGLRVSSVAERSPAAIAGVRVGDIVMMLDGQSLVRKEDFERLLKNHRPGERIALRFKRNSQLLEATPVLAGKPVDRSTGPETSSREGKKPQGGRLGIDADDVTEKSKSPVQRGAVVMQVVPSSPAAAIGIQPQDVIVAIDGRVVTGVRSLVKIVGESVPGQQVEVTFFHGDQMLRRSVPVAGADGVLAAATAEEVKKRYARPEEKSAGVTQWLGGFSKMFSRSEGEAITASASASLSQPLAETSTGSSGLGEGRITDTATLAKENQQLRESLQKLEARIAELEKVLNRGALREPISTSPN